MKSVWLAIAAVAVVLLALSSMRERDIESIIIERVPGVSALCKDATYSTSKRKRGTCASHGGVAKWIIK